jgi:hypothetical protein
MDLKKIIRIFINFWLFICLLNNLIGQPSDCQLDSDQNHTIIFLPGVVPTIDGDSLPFGALLVSVYDTGEGETQCAGFGLWQNQQFSFPVFGSSIGSEGYALGEKFKFRVELPDGSVIPHTNVNVIFSNIPPGICSNGDSYVNNGVSCIESFSAFFDPLFLNINPEEFEVTFSAGVVEASIESNTAWDISSEDVWLSFSALNGQGNSNISIAFQENESIISRTGIITLRGDGVNEKTIVLVQNGIEPFIEIDIDSAVVSVAAGQIEFNVRSNQPWSIISSEDWVKVDPNSGENNAKIIVDYEENVNPDPRTAFIFIQSNDNPNQIFKLLQETVSRNNDLFTGESKVLMFPNPASHDIIIYMTDEFDSNIRIKVFDHRGLLVKEDFLLIKNDEIVLNISNIPPGLYTLQIQTDLKTINKKLIKK